MTVTYHWNILQQTEEWFALKCGILSASVMGDIVTPSTLKYADNKTSRELIDKLAVQRITKVIDPEFQSYDMRRGNVEEQFARNMYNDNYALVRECGFVTNDKWGFTIGCSPDGIVGDDRGIEVKSHKQKFQFSTVRSAKIPDEFRIQVQTNMLVTERPFWDFISYSGAMNMITITVEAEEEIHQAIEAASTEFHKRLDAAIEEYGNRVADKSMRMMRILPTEPTIMDDEIISS